MSAAPAPVGISVLLLGVGSELCAIPLEYVVEIMRPLVIEPIAGAPPFVRGLSLVRGTPVPVVELGSLLGSGAATESSRFVALRIGERQVALAVGAVPGIRELDPSMLETVPPLLRNAGAEAVEALGALDEQLLIVLRAGRLLPGEIYRMPSTGEPVR
jgi:purine-binding chemotaxis protein CheW